MVELAPAIVEGALRGERDSLRAFVAALTPVIQARVVRGLLRRQRSSGGGRDVRQEVEDLTQDVFSALFAHDARALRAWDPARGLSLPNFVGLIADRQVASVLRSGRQNPWRDTPAELDTIEPATVPDPGAEPRIQAREALVVLLDRMREVLSPRGLVLFQRLYVDGEPIDTVAEELGMTREAIYAWRNRVTKVLHRLTSEIRDGEPLDDASSRRNPREDGDS